MTVGPAARDGGGDARAGSPLTQTCAHERRQRAPYRPSRAASPFLAASLQSSNAGVCPALFWQLSQVRWQLAAENFSLKWLSIITRRHCTASSQ